MKLKNLITLLCRIGFISAVLALQSSPLGAQTDPDEISWIPQISTPPVIDGEIDQIWKSGTAFNIAKVQSGIVENQDDLSAVWYGLYDDAHFYFLVDINDQILESEAGTAIWRNDGIEVYFNMDNVKPGGNARNGDNYQYLFFWNRLEGQFVNNNTWTGVEWTTLATDDGYVVEIKIPFTTLTDLNAIEGFSFGFDIAITDNDGLGTADSATYWWNSNGLAEFGNIDGAGTVGLGEIFDGKYPPEINRLDTQIAFEGTVSTIDLVATDINESDTLTFSASDLPAFASLLDNGDGAASISIDGQAGDANIYEFSVAVSDGTLETSMDVTLILKDPDVPMQLPVFESVSDVQVGQSKLIEIDVFAIDLDSLNLEITATELPDFATFTDNGDKTGTLVFNPDFSVIPQFFQVSLKVEDPDSGVDTLSFMVEVLETEKLTEFYCDPVGGSMENIGSSESPWGSLQAVFEAGKKFAEGDVIYLRDGYHGEAVVDGANDGVVIIKPESGAEPKFSRLSLSNDSANWVVVGLEISRSFAPVFHSDSLLSIGGSNNTVSNSNINSVEDSTSWTLEDWLAKPVSGVGISGSGNLLVGCTVLNTRLAITVSGNFNTVRNNRIQYFTIDGLRGLGDDLIFEYNYVADNINVDSNHDDAFQSWSSVDGAVGEGTVYRITVRGNTIIQTTDPERPFQGALQAIACFDGMYEGFVIENNVVIVNHWHGITLLGAVDCKILNNTVIDQVAGSGPSPWITIDQHKSYRSALPALYQSRGNVVRNNLATDVVFSTALGEIDHNIEVRASQFGEFFVEYPFDLRLKSGSPAIGAGSYVAAPLRDARGFLRPVEGNDAMEVVDLGAFEYGAETLILNKVEVVDSETGQHLQLSLDKRSLEGGTWFSVSASSDLTNWSAKDNYNEFDVLADSEDVLVLRDKSVISPENPRFADVLISGNE